MFNEQEIERTWPEACKQENVEIDLKKKKREYLRIVSSNFLGV